MIKRLPQYPYIVAQRGGELLSYAYLSPLSGALRCCGRRRRRYICGATAAKMGIGKYRHRLRALPVLRA